MSSSVSASFLEDLKTLPRGRLPNIEAITQPKPTASMFESGRLHTWNNRGLVKEVKDMTPNAIKVSYLPFSPPSSSPYTIRQC